jgi:outer membrane protein assembly factor BamB
MSLFQPTRLALFTAVLTALSQAQSNPVYIDESASAVRGLINVQTLEQSNPTEAAVELQRLLDHSGGQLVPTQPPSTLFLGVRARILHRLQSNPPLLEAWKAHVHDEATATFQADDFETVFRRWPLTQVGLDAALRLGHQHVESGFFLSGSQLLRQTFDHPDADADSHASAWLGIALAATARDDAATRTEALEALHALGPAGVSSIEAAGHWTFTTPARTFDTIHQIGAANDMESLVELSIWSATLEDGLLAQQHGGLLRMTESTKQRIQAEEETGWFTTATPAIAGDLIFLNLGQHVVAFDAFTGQEQWRYAHRAQDITLTPNLRPRNMNDIDSDGRYVVTISGIDYGNARSGDGALLCFNGRTGRLRWSVVLDDHPDIGESEGLFACSPPVLHEGTVYVLARRISAQQVASESLVAIDLIDGQVKWSSWIASSGQRNRGSIQHQVARPHPVDDGILVRSNAGAVALVDAANGDLRWLQRLNTPKEGEQNLRLRPFTGLESNRVPDGVLVHAPDNRSMIVFDLDSGEMLQRHATAQPDSLNNPLYLLGDAHRIYALGTDLRAFDVADLKTPLWTLPWPTSSMDPMPVGRAQLLEDSLIIPLPDRVIQVDTASGIVIKTLQIPQTGNVLLAGTQLLVASPTRLDAYTAFDRAEAVLQERIAAHPERLELYMDLARLAARGSNDRLLMDAGAKVLDRIDDHPKHDVLRNRLLADLKSSLRRWNPTSTGAMEGLASVAMLMRRAAASASQQLDVELAIGDRIRNTDPQQALVQWLRILEQESLADAWHVEDNIHARGATWARHRLSSVGQSQPELMTWVNAPDNAPLNIQLAAARSNLRQNNDVDRLARTLPSTIDRLVDSGRIHAARALLEGWRIRHDDTALLETEHVLLNDRQPKHAASLPSTPMHYDGQLVSQHPGSVAQLQENTVLMLLKGRLHAINATRFNITWSQPCNAIFGSLLQSDAERITLLLAYPDRRLELRMINANTGEIISEVQNLDTAFNTASHGPPGLQPMMPDGRMIDLDEILITANDHMVACARRDGAVLIINGSGSNVELMHALLPLRVVHDFEAWPDGCIAVGPHLEAANAIAISNANPVAYHVNSTSAEVRRIEWPEAIGRVQWIARSPLDDLLLGGSRGIALIPWPERSALWMNTSPQLHSSRKGWATGESLVVLDANDQLQVLSLANGRLTGPLAEPRHRESGLIRDITVAPEGLRILKDFLVTIHGSEANLIGADSLPGQIQHEQLVAADAGLLLISYLQSITYAPPNSGARTAGRVHLYRVHLLDPQGELIDLFDLYPLASRIRAARSAGTTLILETDAGIELVPLPDMTSQ